MVLPRHRLGTGQGGSFGWIARTGPGWPSVRPPLSFRPGAPAQRGIHTTLCSLTATPAELGSWPKASLRATATPIGEWHGVAQE